MQADRFAVELEHGSQLKEALLVLDKENKVRAGLLLDAGVLRNWCTNRVRSTWTSCIVPITTRTHPLLSGC